MGFAAAGVCEAHPSVRSDELTDWLAAGKHGSMSWLADSAGVRTDPVRFLAGARSVIVVADRYAEAEGNADHEFDAQRDTMTGTRSSPAHRSGPPDRCHQDNAVGRIARYARGKDYHKLVDRRLHALADHLRREHPGALFRCFVDAAPVFEREHAQRAGLGWIGKNSLLLHPRLGSYLLLGGVFTTLDLPAPASQHAVTDHCGSCTACIDACPTDAITPYSVDARRCISYLTIERRGPIEPRFFEAIGDRVLGCDVCQEVCPLNSPTTASHGGSAAAAGVNPSYFAGPRRAAVPLLEMLDLDAHTRGTLLTGSAVKRATLSMLRRNAVIAAGNALREKRARHDLAALRERLAHIADDEHEDPLVRETAHAVLEQLN